MQRGTGYSLNGGTFYPDQYHVWSIIVISALRIAHRALAALRGADPFYRAHSDDFGTVLIQRTYCTSRHNAYIKGFDKQKTKVSLTTFLTF